MFVWPPHETAEDAELVICIHGLAETPTIMAPVEWMFRAAGYEVWNLTYPSTLYPIEDLAETWIAPQLDRAAARRVHVVTHSLGGVILHDCLQRHRPSGLGRVVMTSPGLRGSEALEVYRHHPLYRLIYGPASWEGGIEDDAFARRLAPMVDYDLGVVAGSLSLDPLANSFIPWPHDGKISAGRTRLDGLSDHILLPLPHDVTSAHPLALFQIWNFIRYGKFRHSLLAGLMTTAGQTLLGKGLSAAAPALAA